MSGLPLGRIRKFFDNVKDTLAPELAETARLLGAVVSTPAQDATGREFTQDDIDAARRWNDVMPWLIERWNKASADFDAGLIVTRDDVRAIFAEGE